MDYTVTIDTLSRISGPCIIIAFISALIAFCHAFVNLNSADINEKFLVTCLGVAFLGIIAWGSITMFDNENYSGQLDMVQATVTSLTSDGTAQLDNGKTIPTRGYAVGDTITLACLDLGEKTCVDSNADLPTLSQELTDAFNLKNSFGFGRISANSLYLTQK